MDKVKVMELFCAHPEQSKYSLRFDDEEEVALVWLCKDCLHLAEVTGTPLI